LESRNDCCGAPRSARLKNVRQDFHDSLRCALRNDQATQPTECRVTHGFGGVTCQSEEEFGFCFVAETFNDPRARGSVNRGATKKFPYGSRT